MSQPQQNGYTKRDPSKPMIRDIIAAAAKAAGVSVAVLTGPTRSREVILPRHVAIWLALSETGMSQPAVGRAFGDRDHTTVLHAKRSVDWKIMSGHLVTLQLLDKIRDGIADAVDRRETLDRSLVSSVMDVQPAEPEAPLPMVVINPVSKPADHNETFAVVLPVGVVDDSLLSRQWWQQNDARFRAAMEAAYGEVMA